MQVITPDSHHEAIYPTVFLAGGISKCRDWQKDVISALTYGDITIYNPRCKEFDITDKTATIRQIRWEYERLERMDIFTMYFCESESDQPICMYELGRNILRMQNRFPNSWQKRIVVSVEEGYKREEDVLVQLQLCAPAISVNMKATPFTHAQAIGKCIEQI